MYKPEKIAAALQFPTHEGPKYVTRFTISMHEATRLMIGCVRPTSIEEMMQRNWVMTWDQFHALPLEDRLANFIHFSHSYSFDVSWSEADWSYLVTVYRK